MKNKLLTKLYDLVSCFIMYVFTLLCYFGYLISKNPFLSFILMIATILWFYSFVIDFLHLFEFMKDEEER